MEAGPKARRRRQPLPFRSRAGPRGSAWFAAFCAKSIRVPKSKGALTALRLRAWQRNVPSTPMA
jgi:hypothetical protein